MESTNNLRIFFYNIIMCSYTWCVFNRQSLCDVIIILAAALPPTPPPRPTDPFFEPFVVSCNIGVNEAEAVVNCAATVGSSRVNVDSCVLDLDPNVLSEICKSLMARVKDERECPSHVLP